MHEEPFAFAVSGVRKMIMDANKWKKINDNCFLQHKELK
jgi:hypothetical protein